MWCHRRRKALLCRKIWRLHDAAKWQSTPLFLDVLSKLFNETKVDDWVDYVVYVVDISEPLWRQSDWQCDHKIRNNEREKDWRVDHQRLDVHGPLVRCCCCCCCCCCLRLCCGSIGWLTPKMCDLLSYNIFNTVFEQTSTANFSACVRCHNRIRVWSSGGQRLIYFKTEQAFVRGHWLINPDTVFC